MSVEQETVKTGSPQADSASALQLSQCAASCNIAVMVEATAAAPDFVAGCPDPGTAASPNHTHTTHSPAKPETTEQSVRGNNNNIHRRNSFQHPKQQQMKLTKRRITTTAGFKHPNSSKRRRRANSESDSVLPTNFQLGGNIFDPLNLNSLLDEEVNRALNAETPKSSPLPAKNRDPVEILIPRDITDPLNLNSGMADGSVLVSAFRSGGRKRHRNRHHGGSGTSAVQVNLSESGKSESKTSASALLPAMLTSCSALDVSKEPKGSSVTGDSHEHSADSSCKEETMHLSVDTLTSPMSGGLHQHTSRRKRRRNSGKVDPPLTHSTPVVKTASGDRSWDTGGSRKSQSFHTPRRGPKTGPGGHQQSYNHTKDQQKKKFQYGNYDKYYGYRNPGAIEDSRVHVLLPEWFQGKDVLDLGCNSGHLTLYIAKMFRPAHILGLDIDSSLIHVARKNIRHYLSELQTEEARRAWQDRKHTRPEERNGSESHTGPDIKQNEAKSRSENGESVKGEHDPAEAVNDSCHADKPETQIRDNKTQEVKQEDCDLTPAFHSVSCSFPMSLLITRGPIAPPPLTEMAAAQPGDFPSNVSFITANYVLMNDDLLLTQRPEYDVILCLSVTKWVHLNWGDCGLKRLFQRVYRHLHPGGLFILEPQSWESYTRRKKLTDNIRKNYHSIRLKPDQFTEYLINEVGFTSFRCLEAPKCSVRGFQRPIYLFHK